MEDLDPERILDLQGDSRLHVISGGTKVVQHSPPLKTSAGLKREGHTSFSFLDMFISRLCSCAAHYFTPRLILPNPFNCIQL